MEDRELTQKLNDFQEDQPEAAEQQEVIHDEQSVDQSAQPEEQSVAQPVPTGPAKEGKQQENFRKLREQLDRSEREKEQLYEILKTHVPQVPQAASKQVQPPEMELDANDYTPRAYVDQRLRKQEEELARYKQQLYEQTVENQLRTKYPDFGEVVSPENIARLREEYPEIAASLAANPDVGTKAHATYRIINKLGIHTQDRFEENKQRIKENAQKPRPAVATPLAQAHEYDYSRMSDDDMRREREAMERDIRG